MFYFFLDELYALDHQSHPKPNWLVTIVNKQALDHEFSFGHQPYPDLLPESPILFRNARSYDGLDSHPTQILEIGAPDLSAANRNNRGESSNTLQFIEPAINVNEQHSDNSGVLSSHELEADISKTIRNKRSTRNGRLSINSQESDLVNRNRRSSDNFEFPTNEKNELESEQSSKIRNKRSRKGRLSLHDFDSEIEEEPVTSEIIRNKRSTRNGRLSTNLEDSDIAIRKARSADNLEIPLYQINELESEQSAKIRNKLSRKGRLSVHDSDSEIQDEPVTSEIIRNKRSYTRKGRLSTSLHESDPSLEIPWSKSVLISGNRQRREVIYDNPKNVKTQNEKANDSERQRTEGVYWLGFKLPKFG